MKNSFNEDPQAGAREIPAVTVFFYEYSLQKDY